MGRMTAKKLEASFAKTGRTTKDNKPCMVYLLLNVEILTAFLLIASFEDLMNASEKIIEECRQSFYRSIIYVGKATVGYNRSHCHGREAVRKGPVNPKLCKLHEAFLRRGILIVEGFLRVPAMQALIREAAIIRTLGPQLTNKKSGSLLKPATSLSKIQLKEFAYGSLRTLFGVFAAQPKNPLFARDFTPKRKPVKRLSSK